MSNEIIIDGYVSPESLDMNGIDTIEIKVGANDLFKNEQIENYIEQMTFKKNEIKTLRITYGVELQNLEILKLFPDLEKFFIHNA